MNPATAQERLRQAQSLIETVLAEFDRVLVAEPIPAPESELDIAKFFASYRESFGGLKQNQVAPLEFLLSKLVADPPDGLRETAYILATVKHETNDTYEPVREAYWLSDEWRKLNLRYYPWYGRGYVQLTWQKNYKKAGGRLGLDLLTDPDVVMTPAIAYEILLRGMVEGWFTGKKLSDFITENKTDYAGARRIVNGTDRAELIASYAKKFETCLTFAGYAV